MREERGQATVEWVGLVLLAALALGGLAALTARGREDDSLGHALAGRLSCAARGGCAAVGAPRGTRVRVVGGRTGRALRTPRVRLPGGPRSSAWRPGSARRLSRARAADAFQRLRGFSELAKRTWIFCLGYKRWRYELAHPRAPMEPLPLKEALRIANECLNPYAFLAEE